MNAFFDSPSDQRTLSKSYILNGYLYEEYSEKDWTDGQ